MLTTETTLPDGIIMLSNRTTQSQHYSQNRQASAKAAVALHSEDLQLQVTELQPQALSGQSKLADWDLVAHNQGSFARRLRNLLPSGQSTATPCHM